MFFPKYGFQLGIQYANGELATHERTGFRFIFDRERQIQQDIAYFAPNAEQITVIRYVSCMTCNGTGRKQYQSARRGFYSAQTCNACGGTGNVIE